MEICLKRSDSTNGFKLTELVVSINKAQNYAGTGNENEV